MFMLNRNSPPAQKPSSAQRARRAVSADTGNEKDGRQCEGSGARTGLDGDLAAHEVVGVREVHDELIGLHALQVADLCGWG